MGEVRLDILFKYLRDCVAFLNILCIISVMGIFGVFMKQLKNGDICVVIKSTYGNLGKVVKVVNDSFNNIFEGCVWNEEIQIHDVVVEILNPTDSLLFGSEESGDIIFSRKVLPFKSQNLQKIN